jgi:hypothetical protein
VDWEYQQWIANQPFDWSTPAPMLKKVFWKPSTNTKCPPRLVEEAEGVLPGIGLGRKGYREFLRSHGYLTAGEPFEQPCSEDTERVERINNQASMMKVALPEKVKYPSERHGSVSVRERSENKFIDDTEPYQEFVGPQCSSDGTPDNREVVLIGVVIRTPSGYGGQCEVLEGGEPPEIFTVFKKVSNRIPYSVWPDAACS